ncbi:MAG: DUF2284 domain-containing protein [Methanoculleaceae archaeon]
MRPEINDELKKLEGIARDAGADVRRIDPADVVVAEWVRFKCRYGCKGYAKHLNCPPYAPEPSRTRRMLDEYQHGLLLRFDGVPGHPHISPDDIPEDFHSFYRDLIVWVNGTVWKLEKTAFYDGFYRAFGFGAYPCIYCRDCVAEEAEGLVDESYRRFCRHMDLVRPSMEGSGIDVFATAKNVGWELETIPCRDLEYGKVIHGNIRSVGLVLVD